MEFINYTFGIEDIVKEHDNPNTNFTIPVNFHYMDNTDPHVATYLEDKTSIKRHIEVSLSDRYRELL